ncbi:hypothetical protein THITH_12080 [Thioalkalivibrio paradoxus ARh 1]|uniref:Uncharacterized protein n=1 Tax=Thioalkalivibrio paradoxus ARh 1 TaxID=713585 RepID=W0DTL8_9GAMM|nr:hypothetical protein THITH_12080 [Thioalkalivibrio paradoxus ARh 1]
MRLEIIKNCPRSPMRLGPLRKRRGVDRSLAVRIDRVRTW